jgi:hypothetical protein
MSRRAFEAFKAPDFWARQAEWMLSCGEWISAVENWIGVVRLVKLIFASLLFGASLQSVASAQGEGEAWRRVVTEQDRTRLREWRSAWVEGLRAAHLRHGPQIAAEGALLDPDAGLLDPEPQPGAYLCRTIKLGHQIGRTIDWVSYPQFPCEVGQGRDGLTFRRRGGSQRAAGTLYADGPRRMIFLGSLALADERRTLRYSADPERDLAGIFERVGPRRWRLVFPRPTFESIIDVIELVPAS